MMPPIRLVVGEDSYLIQAGLRSVFVGRTDVEVTAFASDLDSLRTAIADTSPDVVMTDVRMPPTATDEGIRLAEELRESHPNVGVVVLSQYEDPEYAIRLLARGSSRRGYLLKERIGQPEQLFHAIHEVAAGRSVVDSAIVDDVLRERQRREDSSMSSLTPREVDVLAEVAKGKSNAAIGETLRLSKRAVEKHINAIFFKLGMPPDDHDVSRRVAATLLYLNEGQTTT